MDVSFWLLLVMLGLGPGCRWPDQTPASVSEFSQSHQFPASFDPDFPFVYSDQYKPALDSFFFRNYIQNQLSFAVLVARRDTILYEYARGYSDYRKKDPLHVRSAFQLASISKPLTATAVLKLADQQRLSLDSPVCAYLTAFPYTKVTVRDLLCHRSGLSNYQYLDPAKVPEIRVGPISNQQLLDILDTRNIRPDGSRNAFFRYCNTNYALLASLVEKVSGMTFSAYMKQEIFDPSGMEDAFVGSCLDTFPKMKSYKSNWVEEREDFCDGIVGDKNIFASVRDLFHFHRALREGVLLSEAMLREAYQPRSFEQRGQKNYGYGWRMYLRPDGTPDHVYHNGWWHGFTTRYYRNLEQDITIIVLSNKYTRIIYNTQPVLQIIQNPLLAAPVEDEP